ncbi:hypothetical protein SAMN02799631_03235 [Methylobacterium sp. 174MFSha1.1]|uniref:hypothetical protein n=1 Tax=Methylobacterium sp. 174MFSha1.1 TaxID=1502749 RepID=UPI0008F1A023|nr:hypothetical protein [Methylobacterium sp. 174MFSha1.1]SFU93356.1 hypothetical protein SAMN02799631_03235 [Methylobacterium sp. 174MFSha1.1]
MHRIAPLAAVAGLAVLLGGCPGREALDLTARPAIPAPPADLAGCFARAFPEIPDRAFGRAEAVRIIADAKLLDRAKAACGGRALSWITDVRAEYGRP